MALQRTEQNCCPEEVGLDPAEVIQGPEEVGLDPAEVILGGPDEVIQGPVEVGLGLDEVIQGPVEVGLDPDEVILGGPDAEVIQGPVEVVLGPDEVGQDLDWVKEALDAMKNQGVPHYQYYCDDNHSWHDCNHHSHDTCGMQ